jgi:hypothetical protein
MPRRSIFGEANVRISRKQCQIYLSIAEAQVSSAKPRIRKVERRSKHRLVMPRRSIFGCPCTNKPNIREKQATENPATEEVRGDRKQKAAFFKGGLSTGGIAPGYLRS